MNKYKEAKEWIDKINDNPKWNRVDIEEPALSQLTELVEKATPKDPPLYQDYDLKKEFWECPTCGSFLCKNGEEYGHGGYCEHCGQRIDWGNEDEL